MRTPALVASPSRASRSAALPSHQKMRSGRQSEAGSSTKRTMCWFSVLRSPMVRWCIGSRKNDGVGMTKNQMPNGREFPEEELNHRGTARQDADRMLNRSNVELLNRKRKGGTRD